MADAPLPPAGLDSPVREGLNRRPGCLCGRSPAPRHRFKTASIVGRARNVASNAGRTGMWLTPRSCLRASTAPSGMASIAGRAWRWLALSPPCRLRRWRSRTASIAGRAGVWCGWAPPFRARRDPGGHRLASSAGRAGVWCGWAPPLRARRDPGGHRLASSAGRAGKDGLKRRPGCGVRGAFAACAGRGRTGVPPHKLQGAGSIGARRPSVQFAAGAPTVERPGIGDGLIRPPAVGRVRDRGVGSCRGAPAANCTHGRPPAPAAARGHQRPPQATPPDARREPSRRGSRAHQRPPATATARAGWATRRSPATPRPCSTGGRQAP